MPLGTEVGFSPGDFVLDGDPPPSPKKGTEPPNFRPMAVGKFPLVLRLGSVTARHLVVGGSQTLRR